VEKKRKFLMGDSNHFFFQACARRGGDGEKTIPDWEDKGGGMWEEWSGRQIFSLMRPGGKGKVIKKSHF